MSDMTEWLTKVLEFDPAMQFDSANPEHIALAVKANVLISMVNKMGAQMANFADADNEEPLKVLPYG